MTWNEAFQQALEMPQHTPEAKLARAELISRVAEDFEQTARLFGKIIISEVFLPDEEKTIKPATQYIAGSAGGTSSGFISSIFRPITYTIYT